MRVKPSASNFQHLTSNFYIRGKHENDPINGAGLK